MRPTLTANPARPTRLVPALPGLARSALALALIGLLSLLLSCAREAGGSEVTVYKSPTCGCCSKWVRHLEEHGFTVVTHDVPDVNPLKREKGVPAQLGSCHTALVDGYVIEGHVPAADITRLLETRPDVAGLAVPGMPIGSPGMEGPNPEAYSVLSFDGNGRIDTYAQHTP